MGRVYLDNNELAGLRALSEVDGDGEYWTTHYASGLDLKSHGADLLATTYEGSYSLWKRLKERGLVDVDGRMSHHTGVAINDKGRTALAEAEAT